MSHIAEALMVDINSALILVKYYVSHIAEAIMVDINSTLILVKYYVPGSSYQ